jgi:hypothetical protein
VRSLVAEAALVQDDVGVDAITVGRGLVVETGEVMVSEVIGKCGG